MTHYMTTEIMHSLSIIALIVCSIYGALDARILRQRIERLEQVCRELNPGANL